MTSNNRASFSTHPIGQTDLDLQPVRETKMRVMNDIPKEPVVPPPPPQVKFNFVDVSFPGPPERESAVSQSHHRSVSQSPKKRSNAASGRERSSRDQVRYDKENSYGGQAQRNMQRDRQDYLSKLLRRGVPVWEEVPEEERAAKVIGGTNPFRHHPYSSCPLTSNVTQRNTNKQKSSKIQAVWEDVKDSSENSYPLEHSNTFIDNPRENTCEGEEMCLKSKAERLNKILRKKCHIVPNAGHDTPFHHRSETPSSHEDYQEENRMLSEAPCGEVISQTHHTNQERVDRTSCPQDTLHQDDAEKLSSQDVVSPSQSGQSFHMNENPQDDALVSQERPRPMMKIYGGRIDNDAISSLSWWPGDKLYKEKNKNEEEEKHEKESTKEKNGKRDLLTSPTETQKKKLAVATQEDVERIEKPQPRVKHYEVDQVRRYMREKQCERSKTIKELQKKQEQEKTVRSERMKELAIKTKQLSQANKKSNNSPKAAEVVHKKQNQLKQQPAVDWGSQADVHSWIPSPKHVQKHFMEQNLSPGAFQNPVSRAGKLTKQVEAEREISKVPEVSQVFATEEKEKHEDSNVKKRSKKDSKRRKKRRSMSDSEAISDIVSRTVEECERKVKSSSVSVESLSSLSSFSCSSSDVESRSSQSESLSSDLDLAPKERAVALGQLAQKLTNKVIQETSNITHREKQSKDVITTPRKATATSTDMQAVRRPSTKSSNVKNYPRAHLSLAQIEKMSVEELIAKMTSMLPNKTLNEGRSNIPQNDHQGIINRDVSENQEFECNTQDEIGSENTTHEHTGDVQGVLMEQFPKLVVPDVPKLKLSDVDRKVREPLKIAQHEDLSMLPGHNVVQCRKDLKSQIQEEKQVFVKMTPSHRVQHRYVNPQPERQHGQSRLLYNPSSRYLNVNKRKLEHAATVIQATYRGYRVRKITNALISRLTPRKIRDASEMNSIRGVPTSAQFNVAPGSYRLSKNNGTSVEESNDARHTEGREQVNWKEIQSVLESKTLKPRKESYYISQRSDLPKWIQPYFVLSETGDIKHFLETQVDQHESGTGEGPENDKSSCIINSQSQIVGTQNHPHSDFEKPMHNVTLIEGPLSDLEKETVSCFNKETQTSYNRYMEEESKRNGMQKAHEAEEFVDLKKLSKKKALTPQNRKITENIQKGDTLETFTSEALDTTQSGFPQKNYENTLEEGHIKEALEGESSFQALENETLESGSLEPQPVTEEGPPVQTSGLTDSSNDNTSALVEEVSAPHELLGEGVHIGPASLRLRLNAELMYQDTLGKALNELHNVEQLNILNRSRQEAMALSQSLALQQQKVELTAQWKTEDEVRTQEEETKRREDYERRLKEKLKQQEEALKKVEKTEREARNRFAELEREVRARAEQMIAQATERIPQPSSAQSDVIAAAAVAAVGATISQWKQLRPVSHGSITVTEESVPPESVSNQNNASSSKLFSDETHSKTYSVSTSSRDNQSAADKTSTSVSENLDENLPSNSVIEEQSASQIGTELEMNSTQDSVPESIASLKGSVPTVDQQSSVSASSIKTKTNGFTQSYSESISQSDRKLLPKGNEYISSISEKIDDVSNSQTKVSSDEVMSASNLVPEDILNSKTSDTVSEAISKTDVSSATKNSETDVTSNVKSHSQTQKSINIKDKKHQMKESVASRKNQGSPLMSLVSKSKEKERKKEERDTSDIYSESFEVDSENENSTTLSSQFQGRSQGAYGGDLTLVVSSGNILNDMGYRTSAHGVGGVTAPMHGGGESALGVTLSVVESLLKEEEVHHQHQKALLKLQEQSLVEEARWKLAALQSEGGPGMRRRQRVIVLQLREQKAYLRRLRETQNIGAQQRKLMLMQLHHLLGTTTNLPGFSTKSYLTAPRGQSPNPSSPRLTPRVMEMYSSSSSDVPEDVTLNLLVRGRDSDSTSPSESGGGREKRRSHSEDRQKIVSGRFHEKRRTAEIEALQQQLLHEDKEILRLKAKSSYDIHDKDSVKPKRKGDFITKRSREKKEKSSGSVSPHSFMKQGSRTLTDSSVPAESMVATTHNSQSSVHEEVSSEVISHSDVTSSVSEQEGMTSTSHRTGNSQSKESSGSKRPLSYAVSERKPSESHSSKIKMTSSESETIKEQYSDKDSKSIERNSSSKSAAGGNTIDSGGKRLDLDKSERNSRCSEKTSITKSEVSEKHPESEESSIRTKFGSSGSAKSGGLSNKSNSVIPEDITDNSKTKVTTSSSWCSTETRTDSATKSSDSKSVEGKSFSQKSSTRGLPLPLKVPLSPRSPHRQHRRYSSESDDSFTLSQTETASDMSDGEGKLLALKEELAVRRAEAERLKKEKRRLRRERLASQERALKQQISTYDAYIQHARMELEKESKELQQASMVRPLIKKPQVAETKKSRLSESFAVSPEKSDHSDVSLVSEGSRSDHSSVSKSLDTSLKEMQHIKPLEIIKAQELHLKHMGVVSSKDQTTSSGISKEVETKEPSSSSKKEVTETGESQRENESEKTSLTSSISESLNEESVSEHTEDDYSSKNSLSQESSVETDPTQSQPSSTETIVHSPQKLDSSPKDETAISMNEVNAALLQVLKDNYKNEPGSLKKADDNEYEVKDEAEKKLEIYIPTSGLKSSEGEDFMEGNTNTSAEQSMCEEVLDEFEEAESEGFSQEIEGFKDKLPPVVTDAELEPHKKNDISYSSSPSEDKESSLKTDSATEVKTSTSHTPEAKEIPSENESRRLPPTPDRQRLVDDISNNILAIMMKETSQLFTSIVKDKIGVSKSSETKSFVEVVRDSTSTEVSGKTPEAQTERDGAPQCQHSSSSVPGEDSTVARPVSSNKVDILQQVNELIGKGGSSVSPHLPSVTSPRSGDVQLTPQMTPLDLSSESSSPVSPVTGKPSKVEKHKAETEESKSDSPEETSIPSLPATQSNEPNKDKEDDSLSPSHDLVKAEEYKLDTETLTDRLLNLASVPELELEAQLGQLAENTEFAVEGIEGNWLDDDFWTSSDNKKKQQQLKAEEERITAEIARLEELQHLQQKYPGLIFRQVPDKPPPPYTPPQVISPPTSSPVTSPTPVRPPAYSSPPTSPVLDETESLTSTHSSSISHRLSKADQRRLAAHVTQVVPITEEEALPIIDSALDILYEAWCNNIDPGDIPPPPHTVVSTVFSQSCFNEEGMHEDEKTSTRAFHLLLFCLARELLSVPYKMQNASLPPPWMKQALPHGRMMSMMRTKSHTERFSHIREQVKVLFGWRPALQKESLMIRWAQKHRDLVDQVLVKELQAEEASWTNYDEDEAAAKTKVASEIFDALISETVALMSSILVRKLGYIAQ